MKHTYRAYVPDRHGRSFEVESQGNLNFTTIKAAEHAARIFGQAGDVAVIVRLETIPYETGGQSRNEYITGETEIKRFTIEGDLK
jgi:hypothetical protein